MDDVLEGVVVVHSAHWLGTMGMNELSKSSVFLTQFCDVGKMVVIIHPKRKKKVWWNLATNEFIKFKK
jgi:hypothetical protein